mmetsp:Transcript_132611/g.412331  ORF Transcript_132611/g.412331 Transcript_132611/m.412331 type:complete len:276 (-) Transcript_132611:83-910(-)
MLKGSKPLLGSAPSAPLRFAFGASSSSFSSPAAAPSSLSLRIPMPTNPDIPAAVPFSRDTYSGSKLSAFGTGLGNSGPSPVRAATSSSSCLCFSIHSLIRSTAFECRRRRPDRSRMESMLVVFFPRPFCPRSRAPKPPFPPNRRNRTRTTQGRPALMASRNREAHRSSSRSFSRKSSLKSSSSCSSSSSLPPSSSESSASPKTAARKARRTLTATSAMPQDKIPAAMGTNLGFSLGTCAMTPSAIVATCALGPSSAKGGAAVMAKQLRVEPMAGR